MGFLYDFGISQDDPHVEGQALDLESSNLLCIASGGEVPLTLLANYNVKIKSIDTSINQLHLNKLKLASVLILEPNEASVFLGFKKDKFGNWNRYFSKVKSILTRPEIDFWDNYKKQISRGPIKYSRFEQYLPLFCKLVLKIVGRKRFIELIEMDSIESQRSHFDKYLDRKLVLWIFKIAFSPLLYKGRGLDKKALIHHEEENMALLFYKRFRDFCTSTPAKFNYYLQFYFIGEVMFDHALPDYLKPEGMKNIRNRNTNLLYEARTIQEEISKSEKLEYRNYALSNLSDWLSVDEMNDLLHEIFIKTQPGSNLLLRYIHKNPFSKKIPPPNIKLNFTFNKTVRSIDRFPFYSLIKVQTNNG